jgi:hypothetical protein
VRHQIVGFECGVAIPADLAGHENQPAGRRDAVRVAARLGAVGWLQYGQA